MAISSSALDCFGGLGIPGFLNAEGLASIGASNGWTEPPMGTEAGSAYIDSRMVPIKWGKIYEMSLD